MGKEAKKGEKGAHLLPQPLNAGRSRGKDGGKVEVEREVETEDQLSTQDSYRATLAEESETLGVLFASKS